MSINDLIDKMAFGMYILSEVSQEIGIEQPTKTDLQKKYGEKTESHKQFALWFDLQKLRKARKSTLAYYASKYKVAFQNSKDFRTKGKGIYDDFYEKAKQYLNTEEAVSPYTKQNIDNFTENAPISIFNLKQNLLEIENLLSFINYNISFDYDKPSHYFKMKENLKRLNIVQIYNEFYKRGLRENIDLFEIGKKVSNYLKLIGNLETAQEIYSKNIDIANKVFSNNQLRFKQEYRLILHQGYGFFGKPEEEVNFCKSEFGNNHLTTLMSLRCLSCRLMANKRFKDSEDIIDSLEQGLEQHKQNESYSKHKAYLHFQRGKLQYFIASEYKEYDKLERAFCEFENAITFFKAVNNDYITINYVYYFLFKSFLLVNDNVTAEKYYNLIKDFFTNFPDIHMCHTDIIDIKIALKLKQ